MAWSAARGTYNIKRKTKINDDDRISAKSKANLFRVKCACFQLIFHRLTSSEVIRKRRNCQAYYSSVAEKGL